MNWPAYNLKGDCYDEITYPPETCCHHRARRRNVFAASNGDVEKCRAALTEQSEMDMSNYRLSYDREEGNRTKTIYFTAVSTDGGKDLNVTCTIKRSKVLAVNDGTKEISLLASNDSSISRNSPFFLGGRFFY